MNGTGSLRVGHREREHVVHVLMQQYAEGRLAAEELDRRSAAARSALTYRDLDRLVVDLPVPTPSVELRRAARTADLALLGTDRAHRQTYSAGMSNELRRGVWTVPAYLSLSTGLGTVRLDFQQAICPHEVVDIAVFAGMGSILLVVPDGWGADTDQVRRGLGGVGTQVDAVPQPGKPLLVLHGSCAVGTVTIRYPSRRDRRWMRKSLRRNGSSNLQGTPGGSDLGLDHSRYPSRQHGPDGNGSLVGPGPGTYPAGPQDAPPGRT